MPSGSHPEMHSEMIMAMGKGGREVPRCMAGLDLQYFFKTCNIFFLKESSPFSFPPAPNSYFLLPRVFSAPQLCFSTLNDEQPFPFTGNIDPLVCRTYIYMKTTTRPHIFSS
jgi:hypothetical protein